MYTRKRQMFYTQHAVRKIYDADRIGIVGFKETGFVIARPAEAYSPWLQERTSNLYDKATGKGTNITDGLRKSIEMLRKTPIGVLRRIYLLTDGIPNREEEELMPTVENARRAWININTCGFGDDYDKDLLQKIASSTHNGKFIPIESLRQLTDVLISDKNEGGNNRHKHRSETTIFAVDFSQSMQDRMEDKSKIEVVEEAILRLLLYKQKCFS
ncbi:MAG: vWA domain-containing protein [Candidatus Jettenia caeni]|nr:MAG: vWA domain-containing protein [Candidatus Jettenia caeni]